MKKVTVEATTREREDALKAAVEAEDFDAQEANVAWTIEVDMPESIEEAVTLLGADEALKLLCQKYVVKIQQDLRNEHAPRSDSARERALIKKLLRQKGVTLDQLEAELGAE